MTKKVPTVAFAPQLNDQLGFEIVSIAKIRRHKDTFTHNPELPHQLKFYNLIFFTEGQGQHFVDFKWYPVQRHSLLYLTSDQVNAFDFSTPIEGYCIIFTEQYFLNCFPKLAQDFVFRRFNPQLFSPVLQIPEDADFNVYFDLLQKEYHQFELFNRKTILESLFVILISKAETIKQSQTFQVNDSAKIRTFQKFSVMVEDNLTKSRSADFYAGELAMTYKHLNTICKTLLNKTAKQIIDDRSDSPSQKTID